MLQYWCLAEAAGRCSCGAAPRLLSGSESVAMRRLMEAGNRRWHTAGVRLPVDAM
jgi:hypothetical protein